jgi:pimeloyl-ACP methyl ester carboxylesterase
MFISIGSGEIHYEVRGEGRPIVMLHGFRLDSAVMRGCMEPLFQYRKGWKRVYVDLPGMGMSPRVEGLSDSDAMLDALVRFVDSELAGEHFCVAGESYGGYMARGILRERMAKVNGLLLICPLIIAPPSRRKVPRHKVLAEEEGILEKAGADAFGFAEEGVVLDRRTLARYRSDILPGLSGGDKEFLDEFFESGYELSSDVDRLPHPFHLPALVLLGRQDSAVGYVDALRLMDNLPRGTFAVLDRAGHNLQFEQMGLFDALVGEWLDRVEESLDRMTPSH